MPVLVRTDDVRRQNTRLVMDTLRRLKRVSRTEIAKHTGLSPATISSITSGLLDDGILISHEQVLHAARRGRPRIILSLNPEVGCVVSVVLSMNTLVVGLQDYAGQVLAHSRIHFNSRQVNTEQFVTLLKESISELLSERTTASPMPLRYIALGVQGVIDVDHAQILWTPITQGKNIGLAEQLAAAFKVVVWVDNDCNMLTKALNWRHPEQFGKNFAAILLAQGIGMGLMLNGKIFSGTTTSGNEFGHVTHKPNGALCRCGLYGCIEAYAGDYALWRRMLGQPEQAEPLDEVDEALMAERLIKAAQTEGVEREACREAGQAIGFGLRSLFALTDPVTVAFVGKSAEVFALMEPEIRKALPQIGHLQAVNSVHMHWYEDAEELISAGCAIHALQAVDHMIKQLD